MQEFNVTFEAADGDAEWANERIDELAREVKRRNERPSPILPAAVLGKLDEAQARTCKIEAWMKAISAELQMIDISRETMVCYVEQAEKDACEAKKLLGNVISEMYGES